MVSETCSVGQVPALSKNKYSCPAQVVSGYFILVRQTCSRRSIRKLAASETRSLGQSLPLNPNKRRLGFAKLALIDVNAQGLTALTYALIETSSARQVPALRKLSDSCSAKVVSGYFILVRQTCSRQNVRKLAASETSSARQILPLRKISDSCSARPNRSHLFP